jgi:hypothetical protein
MVWGCWHYLGRQPLPQCHRTRSGSARRIASGCERTHFWWFTVFAIAARCAFGRLAALARLVRRRHGPGIAWTPVVRLHAMLALGSGCGGGDFDALVYVLDGGRLAGAGRRPVRRASSGLLASLAAAGWLPCRAPLALILGTGDGAVRARLAASMAVGSLLVAGAEAIGALGRLLYVFLSPQRCHARPWANICSNYAVGCRCPRCAHAARPS